MDADNENGRETEGQATPRSEGVRIIGADEAAAALEAGQAEGRRPEDAPRFGDVPEQPEVSDPPAARFPLPNAVDPTEVRRSALSPNPEMPHWTDPPTGEVPAALAPPSAGAGGEDDDLAAWSGFTGGGARWRDQPGDWDDADFSDAGLGVVEPEEDELFPFAEDDGTVEPDTVPDLAPAPGRRRRARISSRPSVTRAGGRGVQSDPDWLAEEDETLFAAEAPAPRPARGAPSTVSVRIASGLGVGLLLLVLAQLGPVPLLAMSTAVVMLAAVEGFGALRRGGYRPATLLGLTACLSLIIGAYLKGETALPLVAALTVVFAFLWYMAGVVRARPLVNIGATLTMFMWVGFLGSFAGLLLDPTRFPHRHGVAFLMAAVVATVGYDVGGFAIGSRLGRRPLAPTISPNKTWEGLIGGMLVCLVVTAAVVSHVSPWDFKRAIALGLLTAVVAPLGDLCQSMIKRDLGLKDMGTILPGHGGFLDRIDALLFVLPATYYLVRALGIG